MTGAFGSLIPWSPDEGPGVGIECVREFYCSYLFLALLCYSLLHYYSMFPEMCCFLFVLMPLQVFVLLFTIYSTIRGRCPCPISIFGTIKDTEVWHVVARQNVNILSGWLEGRVGSRTSSTICNYHHTRVTERTWLYLEIEAVRSDHNQYQPISSPASHVGVYKASLRERAANRYICSQDWNNMDYVDA